MYVCVYVRHAQKIAELFFSVRSTQFLFKLNILFIKKYINLLGPKTLRTVTYVFAAVFTKLLESSRSWKVNDFVMREKNKNTFVREYFC